ncbi:MAG: toprim domain-containing protein, partial [Desulfobacterales bacterium]|nr:toprim domain-containing protein [Desulfobacterales bacterium]
MTPLIDQLKAKLPKIPNVVTDLKKESENSLCGPCPKCGGEDRFVYKTDSGKFWCRQCRPAENSPPGDIIDFHKWLNELTTSDLIKKYFPKDEQGQKEPGKKESPAELWASIIQKYTNDNPVYRLFSNRRKINKDAVSQVLAQGEVRFFKHRGKEAVACAFRELDGDKNVLAVQCLSVDEKAFSYTDENKVFTKGSKASESCFFQAGTEIKKANQIIICEAVINAISGAECMPDACFLALGGSTLYKKVKALRKYRDNGKQIICFFDNDEAGRKATQSVAKLLGVKTKSVKWLKNAPDGQDINDLLKIGGHKIIVEMISVAKPVEIERSSTSKGVTTSKFSARVFSEALLSKYNVRFDSYKRFWFYNKDIGLWTENAEQILEFALRKGLLPEKYLSRYYVREVLSDTKSLVFDLAKPAEPAPELIPFKNGIFNLSRDNLEAYKPELFFTNQLPVKYKPDASCPLIDQIFSELVADPDILFELCAYCLCRSYQYAKWFFLYGSGGNGKSLFTNILAMMLGHENVKSLTPHDLQNNRFASAGLFGKLANIAGEISYQKLEKTDVLKRLVGGDLIRGERKFKDAFYFQNYAKLIFNTNELPKTYDQTRAFYRRLYLVEFPNRFEGKLEDKSLISKITKKELEGLTVKSLKYLKAFIDRGYYFASDASVEELQAKYTRLTNPLNVFLSEHAEFDANGYIAKWEFKDKFTGWLQEKGYRIWNNQEITQGMKSSEVEEKHKDFEGKRWRAWVGLKWKKQKSDHFDHFEQQFTPKETIFDSRDSKGVDCFYSRKI